jgi:hypothetical protein
MTAELFGRNLRAEGLSLLDQVSSWGPGGRYAPPVEGDVITIFQA